MQNSVLIINSFLHDKNKQGILNIFNTSPQIKYKIGTLADIPHYDIIYSPSEVINSSLYPTKKFIFGPHFSVFPNPSQLDALQANKYKNSIYIQPSEWAAQTWKDMGAEQFIPIRTFAFPVDTTIFAPTEHMESEKTDVFLYIKQRHPNEISQLKAFLALHNITTYKIFDYSKRYNERDYINTLQKAKYGIWLGRHESQGFALEEALAMNVPLLVWDVTSMNQEEGYNYKDIPATTIPYWDSRCGEYFHHLSELPAAFQTLQTKLKTPSSYNPRQYVLEQLSTEKCRESFMKMII